MSRRIFVTGSSGLIGSEVVSHFASLGWEVHGVDNDMRSSFFEPAGDTRWSQSRLIERFLNFRHHEVDIRDGRVCPAPLRLGFGNQGEHSGCSLLRG